MESIPLCDSAQQPSRWSVEHSTPITPSLSTHCFLTGSATVDETSWYSAQTGGLECVHDRLAGAAPPTPVLVPGDPPAPLLEPPPHPTASAPATSAGMKIEAAR